MLNEQVNQTQMATQTERSTIHNVIEKDEEDVETRLVQNNTTMGGMQSFKNLLEDSPLSFYQDGRSSS